MNVNSEQGMICGEQTKAGGCLTDRLSGKQRGLRLFKLPAQRGAEGVAE